MKISNKLKHTDYPTKYNGWYSNRTRSIVMFPKRDFIDFVKTLSHEYGHFIDRNYPDLGMLGAQIAFWGDKVYNANKDKKIYKTNPTEVSSFKIMDTVAVRISELLQEYARKKPAVYMDALNTLFSCEKAQLAGMEFKYRKLFKSVQVAETNYQNIKNKVARTNINVMQNSNVQHAYNEYQKLARKIPPEYTDLRAAVARHDRVFHSMFSNKSHSSDIIKMSSGAQKL